MVRVLLVTREEICECFEADRYPSDERPQNLTRTREQPCGGGMYGTTCRWGQNYRKHTIEAYDYSSRDCTQVQNSDTFYTEHCGIDVVDNK
eukprot:scaffold647886_cov41-Prasinocladus_malaysianus.AAC.2